MWNVKIFDSILWGPSVVLIQFSWTHNSVWRILLGSLPQVDKNESLNVFKLVHKQSSIAAIQHT